MRFDRSRKNGRVGILVLMLVLGTADLVLGWHHIYWGPTKNPEATDYVLAWVSHVPHRDTDPSFHLVPPGGWFWAAPGRDLDFFIRRDLSAVRFRGVLAYFGYRQQLSREGFLSLIDEKDRTRILTQVETLFNGQFRTDEAERPIGTTEGRASR